MKRVCVCGLGKLGACVAAVFAASGVRVVGLDTDEDKVGKLKNFVAPVNEPDLGEYLAGDVARENLSATTCTSEAVRDSDGCLFVVPTPSLRDGSFDHGYLLDAMDAMAREAARQHKWSYLFIVNSTVVPGFLRDKAQALLARRMPGVRARLAYKPEFIALGQVISDLHSPDMLVIGADLDCAGDETQELYRQMVTGKPAVKRMSLVEAELTKISLNCAVTMKISFANQVGLVANKLGADPEKILDAVGEDRRVGHASLRYGLSYSGPCFPRDNRMFCYVANRAGERAPLAEATDAINRRMIREMIDRVPRHGDVGILGLAYKPGSSLTDESPGVKWRDCLRSAGRRVKTHDPVAPCQNTLDEVLACPTIIVACAHPEYQRLVVGSGTYVIDPMGVAEVAKVIA